MDINKTADFSNLAKDIHKQFPFCLLPYSFFEMLLKSVLTLIFVK